MVGSDLELRVDGLRREADGIISLTLTDPKGGLLPHWEPGAHVQIHLPSGRTRQYSLLRNGQEKKEYRIAVKNVPDSRGGSIEIHSKIRLGDILGVDAPVNRFALEAGSNYLFIAAGIGITPILPMVQQVEGACDYHLYYAGRSLSSMALLNEIALLPNSNVTLAVSGQSDRLNIEEIVKTAPFGSYVYACGPNGLLDELRQACALREDVKFRMERFSAPSENVPTEAQSDSFEVIMKRSGRRVVVPADSTILTELLKIDPTIRYSCCEGYCGSCETRVIKGEVDHRDSLLSDEERARNKSIMICVSRARDKTIVLDI